MRRALLVLAVCSLVVNSCRRTNAPVRQAMGIAVFSGMIGVTLFGLFLTPVFYVTLMKLTFKKKTSVASKSLPLVSAGATTAIVMAVLLTGLDSARASLFTVGPDYKAPSNSVPANYKAAEY